MQLNRNLMQQYCIDMFILQLMQPNFKFAICMSILGIERMDYVFWDFVLSSAYGLRNKTI